MNAPELVNVTDSVTTEKEAVGTAAPLKQSEWVPQLHVLKNAEANTNAYGLNQKTMQALDVMAKEYEIFEETMKKVTYETEEGDMLFTVAYDVTEELHKAWKGQEPSARRDGGRV